MGTGRLYENALTAALSAALALAMTAPAFAQDEAGHAARPDYQAVEAAPGDDEAFAKLLAGLPVVRHNDGGTERTFYLWEGDMLMSAEEIQAIIFARLASVPARSNEELLLQVRADGQPGFWQRGKRALSYAVDCSTFTDVPAQCAATKQKIALAAKDWVRSCANCGLSFTEVPATPGIVPSDQGPSFVVRYQPNQYDYIALAFFANDPAYKRYVSVTPGFFTTSFDTVGVLRHELGHVLGYRHEHIRAIRGCVYEDDRWKALTEYDSKSVMHYFCGGGGTRTLTLSAKDKGAHASLYGAP